MSTTIATTPVQFRDDVAQLLQRHLAGIDPSKLSEPEKWDRYRSFRTELHNLAGCGAPADLRDNAMFLRAIDSFTGDGGIAL